LACDLADTVPMPRQSMLNLYINRRMATLIGLGFASGLPLALTQDTFSAWMKNIGVDLAVIGLLSLVRLPYSLKVLWAPLMDRFVPPIGLGRRRAWLVVTQIGLIAGIALMAFVGPQQAGHSVQGLAIVAVIVAFMSASQDIVSDAYRTDVLPGGEVGSDAAVYVAGFRMAMVVSAAGALILAGQHVSWRVIYLIMACIMSLGLVATLMAREPAGAQPAPSTMTEAVIEPFQRLLSRHNGWLILVFVVVFKLPDYMASVMTMPFLLDCGFSNSDIGYIRQALGLVVTIGGALVGAGIVGRIGLMRSLVMFGILQAVSNAGFLVLANAPPTRMLLIGVIGIESFCAGLVAAGFVGFLMSCCDRRYAATQYALLTSLMTVASNLGGAPTGYLAKHLGYPAFFAITIAIGIPGLLMLPWLCLPRGARDEAVQERDVAMPVVPQPSE
jgi:MFS transporter, PAT family, beta-lactamase induction signal transducer AmpG